MAEAGQRKLSTKIVVCCVVFTTILSIVIGWLGYKTYSESVLERYHVYVDSIIKVAASSIDGDDMRTCIDTLQKVGHLRTNADGPEHSQRRDRDGVHIYGLFSRP